MAGSFSLGGAIDRAIAVLSPRAGAERAFWREQFRSYDAANKGARGKNWRGDRTSVSSSFGRNGETLEEIRVRCRELVANNPFATSAVGRLAANIVGSGIEPRLKSASVTEKQTARDDWERFSENCDPRGRMDFNGVQALAVRTAVESGEALVRWHYRDLGFGLEVPLQCEVLEPDWIDSRVTRMEKDAAGRDSVVVHGVALDADGRLRGYYLFDRHPGDDLLLARKDRSSKFVEARYIDHMFNMIRPEQMRGLPWLAPAALRMHELRTYEEFELNRKIFASMFVAFVRQQAGPTGPRLTDDVERQGNRQTEKARPGMVKYLKPGEDVTLPQPPVADGYMDYVRTQHRAIAAGVGCTYEQLTGDYSQVTYLSSRAARQEFFALLDTWQWQMAIPQLCRPAWARVQQTRAALGRSAGFGSADWQPPARPWVDPVKDADAEEKLMRLGLKTWPQAVAERGYDPQQQLAEIAASQTEADDLGLKFDSDARVQKLAPITLKEKTDES